MATWSLEQWQGLWFRYDRNCTRMPRPVSCDSVFQTHESDSFEVNFSFLLSRGKQFHMEMDISPVAAEEDPELSHNRSKVLHNISSSSVLTSGLLCETITADHATFSQRGWATQDNSLHNCTVQPLRIKKSDMHNGCTVEFEKKNASCHYLKTACTSVWGLIH